MIFNFTGIIREQGEEKGKVHRITLGERKWTERPQGSEDRWRGTTQAVWRGKEQGTGALG